MAGFRTSHIGTSHFLGTLDVLVRVGSIDHMGSLGNLAGGRIGSVGYVQRVGTIGRIGSVRSIGSIANVGGGRIGSLGYLNRLGTLGRIGSVRSLGSLANVGGGRIGSIGYLTSLGTMSTRGFIGTVLRSGIHTSRGSIHIGSWIDVRRHYVKTFEVQSTSTGTLGILASQTGSATVGATGTYYSVRKGNGSYVSASFTESLRFVRFNFLPGSVGGPSASGKGTLWVTFSRQG